MNKSNKNGKNRRKVLSFQIFFPCSLKKILSSFSTLNSIQSNEYIKEVMKIIAIKQMWIFHNTHIAYVTHKKIFKESNADGLWMMWCVRNECSLRMNVMCCENGFFTHKHTYVLIKRRETAKKIWYDEDRWVTRRISEFIKCDFF